MKRLLYILALPLLLASCQTPDTAEPGDLAIWGFSNNMLHIEGRKGASASFMISSKHSWKILNTGGFTCEPSSGEAGENIEITATATAANNTLDTLQLGRIDFKLKDTRFIGVVAHQLPQITFKDSDGVLYTEANKGNTATVGIVSTAPDFEIVGNGLDCELTYRNQSRKVYEISVTSSEANLSSEYRSLGRLDFYIDGERQEASVDVRQHAALRIDKEKFSLSGGRGSKNSFSVITPFQFDVRSLSQNLYVEKSVANTVTVTALVSNTTDSNVMLGEVELYLTDNPDIAIQVEVYQRIARAPQSILFHFIGTNLLSHFKEDVDEVCEALKENILGDSRVLVFIQSSGSAAALYEYTYDPTDNKVLREHVNDYVIPAVYSREHLQTILSDMVDYAPAERYGLVVGSHGRGWLPSGENTRSWISDGGSRERSQKGAGYDPREAMWIPVEGAPQMRHLGDRGDARYDIDEFADAVAGTGVMFDYILFDACFMSNVESLYRMRNIAQKIIASPCEIMGGGFPYQDVLPMLLLDKGVKYDLDGACRKYVDYYSSYPFEQYRSACVALVDCSQLEALVVAAKRVNESVAKEYDPADVQIYDGLSSSSNPTHVFYDLEDYVMQSCSDAAAVDAFRQQLDRTVGSRYHTPKFYSAYNGRLNDINYYSGITTSAPCGEYAEEWIQTDWYRDTH